MTMSESDRRAKEQELSRMSLDFQRMQRSYSEDLNLRRNQELQSLFERANRVIKQIAEAEKFDLILQEAVYRSPRLDITERVLKALSRTNNEGAPRCERPGLALMSGTGSTYTLREIAERFGGEIVGDANVRIDRVATLENAGPGAIAFLANARYLRQLQHDAGCGGDRRLLPRARRRRSRASCAPIRTPILPACPRCSIPLVRRRRAYTRPL